MDLTSQYYLELVVLLHAVAAALAFSRAHELYIIQHDTMCQKNSLRGLRTRFFFAKGGRRAAQNSLEKHDEKWVENLTPRAPAPGQNGPPDRAPAAARIARSRKAVCYRRSARVLKRKVTRPPPRPHRHTPLYAVDTHAPGARSKRAGKTVPALYSRQRLPIGFRKSKINKRADGKH